MPKQKKARGENKAISTICNTWYDELPESSKAEMKNILFPSMKEFREEFPSKHWSTFLKNYSSEIDSMHSFVGLTSQDIKKVSGLNSYREYLNRNSRSSGAKIRTRKKKEVTQPTRFVNTNTYNGVRTNRNDIESEEEDDDDSDDEVKLKSNRGGNQSTDLETPKKRKSLVEHHELTPQKKRIKKEMEVGVNVNYNADHGVGIITIPKKISFSPVLDVIEKEEENFCVEMVTKHVPYQANDINSLSFSKIFKDEKDDLDKLEIIPNSVF